MSLIPPPKNYSAILTGPYGEAYDFTQRKIRNPGPSEALIRLDFSSVCHGDVYSRDGGGPAPAVPIRPLVGGHEGIGVIVGLGETAQTSGFRIGDVVGIAWRSGVCEECEPCRHGAENHCEKQEVVGMHRDGTFQRFISFPADQLIRIPKSIDKAAACPILCAGVTAYTSLRNMRPEPGKWCVIAGAAGGLGHLAIQYAKVFGLQVLAIDGGGADKETFCRRMGCDAYVDFVKAGERLGDQVKAATNGGADYVLLLSPHQSAYNAAGEYARFRGQIMAVGIGKCNMPLRPILKKDLIVRSNETGTKADIEEAMHISASGKVTCEIEVLSLLELNEALDKVKQGRVLGKLVFDLRSLDARESDIRSSRL